MAWEWSHDAETYYKARRNLERNSKKILAEIWAEWQCYDINNADDDANEACAYLDGTYARILKEAKAMDRDELVEDIWNRAEEQRTCTNGGWAPWLCPYGCYVHLGKW